MKLLSISAVAVIVAMNTCIAAWAATEGDVITQPIRTFGVFSLGAVACSPDGQHLAMCGMDDAYLVEVDTGQVVRTFIGHTSNVNSVAFSPDGMQILSGSRDSTAKLWDAATGTCIRTFTGHTSEVPSVAFSPGGFQVLTGSHDHTAKLWDIATGTCHRTFTGHTGAVYSVAFSPDGTQVLTGSNDKTAKLWNAATGVCIRTFTGHTSSVSTVAFSHDGTQVLTGSYDKTAKLWNAATGDCIRSLIGHTSGINSVAFSPDGTQVLTGSYDKIAKLWEIATGDCILTFAGHTDYVYSVAFSPDGTQVLTGSNDKTAKLWQIEGRLLSVRSELTTGGAGPAVGIGGTHPGLTDYGLLLDDQEAVSLVAPDLVEISGTTYALHHWQVEGQDQPLGERSVQLTMQSDTVLVAVYETTQHALIVQSAPITGVSIAGDRPGQTSYTASVGHGESITLSAPIAVAAPQGNYGFIRWLLDGEPQLSGETAIELTFESAHTLVAVYGLIIYVDPADPTGFATIQSAIDAASIGAVVIVRDGIYRGAGNRDISYNGKQIIVKSENGPANCIVDCQGSLGSPARGFFFSGGNINENSILQGITIINGYSIDNGGAVRVSSGASPVINGCVFAENSAHGNGGAIWCSGGSAAIINCTFTDNVSQTGHGGGIYSEAGASLTVSGCTMIGNAAVGSGGAAYFSGGSPVMALNTFTNNIAWTANGGGVCLAATTRAVLSDNTFSGNMAEDYGGAVYSQGQEPVFTGNTFSSNRARYGGGIDCRSCDDASIIDNALDDNNADYGGGMYLKDLGGVMAGNVVADNHANGYGGGLHLRSCSLAMTGDRIEANTASQTTSSAGGGMFLEADSDSWMLNCIIAGNSSHWGGGICVDGSAPTIINCTVSGNSAMAYAPGWDSGSGGICFRGGCFLPIIKDSIIGPNETDGDGYGEQISVRGSSAVSIRYSNIVGSQATVEDGSMILWGEGIVTTDPCFAPAQGDYHLKSEHGRWDASANDGQGGWITDTITSPCIDAGHPVSVFDAEPEPNGGRINMGAYGNTPEASRSASPHRILTVRSSPFEGVSISGDKAGVTNYEASCDEGENVSLAAPAVAEQHSGLATDNVTNYDLACYKGDSVSLSAPAAVTQGSATYRFASWSIDGEPGSVRQAEIVIQMDTDHMAEAIYLLVGDANGDCRVDILDLLFVRNRLLKDVSTDDNWQADVNGDGAIDILDLLFVRNNLNSTCDQ